MNYDLSSEGERERERERERAVKLLMRNQVKKSNLQQVGNSAIQDLHGRNFTVAISRILLNKSTHQCLQ